MHPKIRKRGRKTMEEKILNSGRPYVYERQHGGIFQMDVSDRLLQERIITLNGPVDTYSAENIVNEMLYLEGKDPEKEIKFYINSPGGSVTDGMAIYDTMQYISCPVVTIAVGLAASMGAFLLAGGEKGRRYALPHAEILIHQPLGGASGQATEIDIAAKHILKTREILNEILAERCGQSLEEVEKNTERDRWMSAKEALEFGIIDEIVAKPERRTKS